MKKVEENDTIKIHYKGKFTSGEVFDSSENKDPLEFQVGSGKIIPGLEEAVIGMEKDEEKEVTIPKDKAYGDRNEELLKEIPKSSLPENVTPKVGMELQAKNSQGKQIPVTIAKVGDENIIIDANHPLSGHDLIFEIKLVGINDE